MTQALSVIAGGALVASITTPHPGFAVVAVLAGLGGMVIHIVDRNYGK